ncbi:ketoacyl-synthetase C-terminal extension domain-containing protein [Nonomuraea rubra]|uniref:acyl carrier protein n=1 Tax=Nonomuraea rubra TaxID=46180 RepID=UPI003613BDB5
MKSNVGHLNAAAGVVGLIKAALMLRHRTMVPTVNVTRPHPDLALDDTPFRLLTRAEAWASPAFGPRLAGVSSLGIGGTNVHVVLEEPPTPAGDAGAGRRASGAGAGAGAGGADAGRMVLPLSARTEAQLAAAARRLAAVLHSPGAPPLADVAHTLAHGRATLDARAYVTAATCEEAATALESLATGRTTAGGNAVGAAWAAGQEVTWPETGGRRTRLPTYPFAGDHHGALTLGPPPAPEPEEQATGTEAAVTALFRTTLALDGEQDLDRTYFAAGGDSLTAVFLVSELRDRFALDVPIELFLTERPLHELITRAVHGEEDDLLGDLLDELEQDEPEPDEPGQGERGR